MKYRILIALVLISMVSFGQTVRDTAFAQNGDTVIHVTVNSTASFNYPVQTSTKVIKPKVTNPPVNQLPICSAGSSQSITLPVNSVALNGTAVDNDGNIVSVNWVKTSGGTATIVSASSLNTSVTGLVQGSYVFSLTVSDNAGGKCSSTTSITVNPQPAPPDTSTKAVSGFGSATTGGQGKQTVHVTNLNTTGSGSFHDAIGSNKIIVFDVAGNIPNFRWDAEAKLTNLTIDGTTAPAPGITCIANAGNGLSLENCSNIIVRNIRIRGAAGNDAMNLVNSHDIIVQNVSLSGAHDGLLDISEGCYNVSVQDCIIGNGASDWSGAMLIGYIPTKNITVHHNLFCAITSGGVGERIPFIRANENSTSYADMIVEFKNNLVWRWGRNAGGGSGYASGFDFAGTGQIVNNYYYSTSDPSRAVAYNVDPTAGSCGCKAFVSGNFSGNGSSFPASTTTEWPIPAWAQVPTQKPCDAARKVLAKAGCQPLDATDKAYINVINLPGCPAQ